MLQAAVEWLGAAMETDFVGRRRLVEVLSFVPGPTPPLDTGRSAGCRLH